MDRRSMLMGCSDFLAAAMASGYSTFSFSENDDRDALVVVFLRGGMDGLNFVAPVDDEYYQTYRGGKLGISDKGEMKGLPLSNSMADMDFRIHPKASALKELYDDGSLGIIHASGLTHGTRSHFEAQDLMERGTDDNQNLPNGWLTRYIETLDVAGQVPAYAVGNTTPASLLGSLETMSLKEVKDLKTDWDNRIPRVLRDMYAGGDSLVHQSGQSALDVFKTIQKKARGREHLLKEGPENGAQYPSEWPGKEFGKSMRTVAQLMKLEVGMKVATVDFNGWDTHDGQGWRFPGLLKGLSDGLMAFYNDIHRYHKNATVVVMSEFGRRVKANKNGGTDHGHGNAMMVLGGNVNGGNMYGKWPGLSNEELDKGVDLAITTDYRTVLGEILQKRLQVPKVGKVLPGFEMEKELGIV